MTKKAEQAEPINERALIGVILQDAPAGIAAAHSASVTADAFHSQFLGRLFKAAEMLVMAGKPADMVAILTAAQEEHYIDKVDDLLNAAQSSAFAFSYATQVKADYTRRRLLLLSKEAGELVSANTPCEDIISRVREVLESIEDGSRKVQIVDAVSFVREKIAEPPQVIHGVIRAGQVGMMAASSKAGKSWALLAIGMAVASGVEWLGWKTTPGRVLYINAELPLYDMQTRLETLAHAMGLPGVPAGFDVWHLRGETKTIRDLIPEIMRRIRAAGPYAMILPDPLYCFGGGRDENDNAEQAKTMGELSELAERSAAAVWVAHHFSKGNKRDTDHLDRASGAGMFARAVDTFMTMTRHEEEHAYSVEVTCRSFAKPDKFVVRWEYPIWTVAKDLDPEELKKPNHGGRKSKYTPEGIVAELDGGGMRHGVLYEACRMSTGISMRHFNNLVQKCLDCGLMKKQGDLYVRK